MKWLYRQLKWLLAGNELAALERYRLACGEALRWLASYPDARITAEWISSSGEGRARLRISDLREVCTHDATSMPDALLSELALFASAAADQGDTAMSSLLLRAHGEIEALRAEHARLKASAE